MAIFGKEKNKKDLTDEPGEKQVPAVRKGEKSTGTAPASVPDVLVRPRITEKATILTDKNVYTFEITPDANKTQVAEAIRRIYNVTPKKVRIAKKPRRKVFSRATGTRGVKSGVKKALVTLKDGDTIQFI